jgi:hypothetical protein
VDPWFNQKLRLSTGKAVIYNLKLLTIEDNNIDQVIWEPFLNEDMVFQ